MILPIPRRCQRRWCWRRATHQVKMTFPPFRLTIRTDEGEWKGEGPADDSRIVQGGGYCQRHIDSAVADYARYDNLNDWARPRTAAIRVRGTDPKPAA